MAIKKKQKKKTVKKEEAPKGYIYTINDLTFDTAKGDTLPEALGMPEKKYINILHIIWHMIQANLSEVREKVHATAEEVEENSMVYQFSTFLNSDEFKAVGWNIQTPADYFLLGTMYILVNKAIKDHAENEAHHMHAEEFVEKIKGLKHDKTSFIEFMKFLERIQ